MFQCRQCGRTYEELPASCFCGNANPALWDVQFDAPGRTQPVQQPTDRAPFQAQPVQQPMDRAPFQAQPGGYERQAVQYAPQPAAPQPPKKKSNKGLIAVVIVLALLLAGVGGYLAWDHFANNNVSDAEEEDDDDKKSKDNNNKNGGGEETEEPAATEAPATEAPATEAPTTEAPTTQAPTTTEPPATQPDGLNGNRYTYRGVSITLPDGFWVQEGSMPIAVPREYPQKTDNIVFAFSGKENIDDYNEQSIYSLAETIPGYQELEGFEKGELDGTPAVMFSIKASMNGIDFEEVWIMLFCPDQTVTLTFSSVTGDYDQAFVDAARSITVN